MITSFRNHVITRVLCLSSASLYQSNIWQVNFALPMRQNPFECDKAILLWILRFFHCGCWEKELLLALCGLPGISPSNLFRLLFHWLQIVSHMHVLINTPLILQWVILQGSEAPSLGRLLLPFPALRCLATFTSLDFQFSSAHTREIIKSVRSLHSWHQGPASPSKK